ncbi:hypothetical protein D9758_015968 [Tetrapyrgos nigripes]|uniref:Uncharacterized protein n=1 Tax=Tetrapyrgos nigripes TaxID=182062 RepID=A0A8H5C0X8_9AGAR|nr:hypothetical protein D9758_015968 [Tetrapyrgos nigripes]
MRILQAWLWSLFTTPLTSAVLMNRTVDDTFGDGQGTTIQYQGVWNNANCSTCVAKPTQAPGDPSVPVYDQTWHDGQYHGGDPLTASLTFNGTAVYVYIVLVNAFPSGHIPTSNLSFYIESELVGIFTRILSSQLSKIIRKVGTFVKNGSDLGTPYQYNVPVYVNESLPYKTHNFTLVNGYIDSLILLDKMVYTYDDGLSANTTDQNNSLVSQDPNSSNSGFFFPNSCSSHSDPFSRIISVWGRLDLFPEETRPEETAQKILAFDTRPPGARLWRYERSKDYF